MQQRFDAILGNFSSSLGKAGPGFLLAVSGGVDSMVMADLFAASALRPFFAVAHCNFRLRGEESDSDEELVSSWCESNGARLFARGFDTVGYASGRGISIEMAARDLRYSFFAEICSRESFDAVVVAHNANDNAETLILNLLRGTGSRGLQGIRQVSAVPVEGCGVTLFRPLLSFSREEIEGYAVSHGIGFHEDRTNSESKYKRNMIRNEVFPVFSRINPSFIKTFSAETGYFSQVNSVADSYFEAVRPSLSEETSGKELLKLTLGALTSDPNWEYVLFRFLEPFGFSSETISALARSVADPLNFGGRVFCSPSAKAVLSPNDITVVDGSVKVREEKAVTVVEGPGEYRFGDVQFRVSVRPWLMGEDPKRPAGTLVFDSGVFRFPFVVRSWNDGDWMVPLGMRGRRKLSDIFSDGKKGLLGKGKAGVIAHSGSRVDGILGERIDDSVKVTDTTVMVTEIKII